MRWLRLGLLVIVGLGAFGFGWRTAGQGVQDPLINVTSRYLNSYLVAPVSVLWVVSGHSLRGSSDHLLRSGSVFAWWRRGQGRSVGWGLHVGAAALLGTMLSRYGWPIPSVSDTATVAVGVLAAAVLFTAAVEALTSLAVLHVGPAAGVYGGAALWVAMLVLARFTSGWDVLAPGALLNNPLLALIPLSLVGIGAGAAHLDDLRRRAVLRIAFTPYRTYAMVALGAILLQGLVGTAVADEAGVVSVWEPITALLGGIGPSGSLRDLLFYLVVYVGFGVAWAFHLEDLLGGAMTYQLIRSRSTARWLWRAGRVWVAAAPLTPLMCLAVAAVAGQIADPSDNSLLNGLGVVQVLINGTLQLVLLVVTIAAARWLGQSVTASLLAVGGTATLVLGHQFGVVPYFAGHGLRALGDGQASSPAVVVGTTAAVLAAACVLLAAVMIIFFRNRTFERSES